MPDALKVWINGAAVDNVDAGDRGLHYGDGLFETMAVRDGTVRFLARHLDRLQRGAQVLGIDYDYRALCGDIASAADGQRRAVIKALVTRGPGATGYRAPADAESMRLISRRAWPHQDPRHYRDGIDVITLAARLAVHAELAGIKHCNRLAQVIAARELDARGAEEGLMCDEQGSVTEGVSSNLFMVIDDRIVTPRLDRCGVAGVMREVVLECALNQNFEVTRTYVRRGVLTRCNEMFITNSIRGIVPIRSVDGRPVGSRAVARSLSHALHDEGITACG